VGDKYPPGPLEGERASRGASGQIPRKAIPSWAGLELLAEWADLRRQQTQAQAIRRIVRYPKKLSDFPAWRPQISGWIRDELAVFLRDQFSRFTIV
jgi:hypothetical protein